MKDGRLKELVNTLLQAKDYDDMLDLLKGLLTIGEIEEISRRLQIVKMLKKGIPQREIANKLKVGIATVTRGAKEIKKGRFSNV